MNASLRRILPAALGGFLLLPATAPATASSFAFGTDDGFDYALIEATSKGSRTVVSSGSWDRIERALDGQTGPVLWFAKDGRAWVVRDPALLAEAQRIVRPMHEIGAKQGKLGAAQGALGAKQGELGREQGRLGRRQGKLGARLGMLATSAAWDDDDRASRAEIRRIEDEMEELGRAQERLARKQEPLAEQQRALGEQQEELGRLQSSATKKSSSELRRLADRAIDSGQARRADD